ncbi:sodium:solute symporter family protein [Brevibacterium aurantiacum]|uniref:Sodium:solute symporter family protein n=1 Tax=Brevibacterium aurantiacum TaxID=273384 RepID=A0A2A3Z1T8_BREAU|nr:sodium:solute symporter family protein [Brevibacterium aurantiacum]PCC45516.1 hypothetical protein CIK64_15385 [Brevibacterium aurantiacum]
MSPWIYIIFFGYLVGVIAIGYTTWRKKNADDYLVAGRRMPYWVVGSAYIATYMSVSSFLGVVGTIHNDGWSANGAYIGSVVGYMGGLAVFGPKLRRLGGITIPDFLGDRFNSDIVRIMSAIVVIGGYFLYFSVQFIGIGVLFNLLFGMSYIWSVVIAFAILLAYVLLGGLLATAYVDVLQLGLMWTGGIAIAVVGINRSGGMLSGLPAIVDKLNATTPEFLNPSSSESAVAWSLVLLWIIGSLSRADTISRAYLAKSEREVYKSILFSMPFIWASGTLFFFFGLIGAVLLPQLQGTDAESTFLIMASDWAPPIFAGMAFTGLLASAQSTVSGQMMTAAMGISRDTFGKVIAPRILHRAATDREVLGITRVALLVLGAASLTFALIRPGFIFDFVNLSVAIMGPAFLVTWIAGMFWRRATKLAAIVCIFVGVIVSVFYFYNPIQLFGQLWLNGPVISLVIVTVLMIVVSLVTTPTQESLDLYDSLKRKKSPVAPIAKEGVNNG